MASRIQLCYDGRRILSIITGAQR